MTPEQAAGAATGSPIVPGSPAAPPGSAPASGAPAPGPAAAPDPAPSWTDDGYRSQPWEQISGAPYGWQPTSPSTPYSFSGALGHCQVGSVWSAVDDLGRPLTVAVLDAAAAHDQRWRDAFTETVNALTQPGPDRPHYVRADVSAAVPWAAYAGVGGAGAGAERVFETLGFRVLAADPSSSAPAPASAPPDPISGLPMSPAGEPYSPAPYGLVPQQAVQDPFVSPVRRIVPSQPRRRRRGLWIGLAVLVVVVLAGGGTLFAVTDIGRSGPTPTASPGASQQPVALSTAPPASPGLEPPKPGAWPTKWPRFTATDSVRTLDLDGLGFPVKVPPTWQCTLAGRTAGFVKYNCGTPPGETPQFGGEIIVRDCPQPCDEKRRTEMRQAEEAWGAQWIRSGAFSTYAEAILQVDGEQRHGLVVVGYWRGGTDGQIDRQLVFRMTAPVKDAQKLRRVATYIRDTLVF